MSNKKIKLDKDTFQVRGSVKVVLRDANGNLKQSHEDHNLIVTAGKNYLAAWLAAASQAGEFMTHIGLGTGTTSPAAGDTALETEFAGGGYARINGTLGSSTNTWSNTAVFGPGNGTGAVTEAGLFSAATVGTMFARQVFSVYNKAAGDTLTVTWSVSFS
jgi:hypothetical protein